MKDLFDKTAEYSLRSDREILNQYLDKYQKPLLTGDYQDQWINEADENRYISKLRQYYSSANKKGTIAIAPSKYTDYADRTRASHALRNFSVGAGLTSLIAIPYGVAYTHASPICNEGAGDSLQETAAALLRQHSPTTGSGARFTGRRGGPMATAGPLRLAAAPVGGSRHLPKD